MALELERRALELLGDRAPAWALQDAGRLGRGVQVDDGDIDDDFEPDSVDAEETNFAASRRKEAAAAAALIWQARTAARLEEELRAEGFERASAYVGAASASRAATPGDSDEQLTNDARTKARQYQEERHEEIRQLRRARRAEVVQWTLTDLGLPPTEASRLTTAALSTAPPSADTPQLLTFALRNARASGHVFELPPRLALAGYFEDVPLQMRVDGRQVTIDPRANGHLARALLALVEPVRDDPLDTDEPTGPSDSA